MKSVLLLLSTIAVLSASVYLAPDGVTAALITIVFALAFGRWLGVWTRRSAGTVFGDNEFAVNSLDADATPAARALAGCRDDE
jgi:hypothetical protein